MYFVATSPSFREQVSDLVDLHVAVRDAPVQAPVPELREHSRHRRPARNAERHDLVARERDGRAVEAEVPVERGARAAVAQEPEPPEPHGWLLTKDPRPRARRVRLAQPSDERPPLGQGLAEPREWLAHEPESLQRPGGPRRPPGAPEGPRGEPRRVDVEAPPPAP